MTKHRTVLIVAASTVALAAVIAATLPDRSTLPVAAPSRDGNSGRALDPGAVERPPSSLIGEEGSGLWSAPLEAVMRLARAAPGSSPAWPDAEDRTTSRAYAEYAEQQHLQRLDAARRRFFSQERDLAESHDVDADLRKGLTALGVDKERLAEVECRGSLCRAELTLDDRELLAASALGRQQSRKLEALDVRRDDPGQVHVVAFLEKAHARTD